MFFVRDKRALLPQRLLKVLRTIAVSWPYGSDGVVNAAQEGGLATFKSVTKILDTQLNMEQVRTFDPPPHPHRGGDVVENSQQLFFTGAARPHVTCLRCYLESLRLEA